MKKLLSAAATGPAVFTTITLLLSLTSPAQAALLGSYSFEDAAGDFTAEASFTADDLSLSAWSDLAGSVTNFAGNPGRAIAARDWDAGNEFRFQINVPPSRSLTLDGFAFDNLASASGAGQWSLSINEQTVASGLTSLSFTNVADALDLSGLGGSFRVRLAGSGASSSTGTWRIDNFQFSGMLVPAPVPLPPAAAMLLPAMLTLVGIARRKRPADNG
jgi:hypothetical protein